MSCVSTDCMCLRAKCVYRSRTILPLQRVRRPRQGVLFGTFICLESPVVREVTPSVVGSPVSQGVGAFISSTDIGPPTDPVDWTKGIPSKSSTLYSFTNFTRTWTPKAREAVTHLFGPDRMVPVYQVG